MLDAGLLELSGTKLEHYRSLGDQHEKEKIKRPIGDRSSNGAPSITSVDELEDAGYMDFTEMGQGELLEEEERARNRVIPPETEFLVHCSNLQAWVEHGYDARLIHSNLAFPLLKRLCEVGDPQAKRMLYFSIKGKN
ncbi:MAG: hypothetical protein ACFFAS_03805 [Promethearchaeota archaeon]